MSDSAMFDQAVATLRGLREELRSAAGHSGLVQAQAVQCWTDKVDTAITDLLEVARRARYGDVLAVGAALADVTVDGPPASLSASLSVGVGCAECGTHGGHRVEPGT